MQRATQFAASLGVRVPIFLAPMAGASAPGLSVAVARAGGVGACGALLMQPDAIREWATTVRKDLGPEAKFQVNLWTPDPPPARDKEREARMRVFLEQWGPSVPIDAADRRPPDYDAQFAAVLDIRPPIISSVMGLFSPDYVQALKARGIKWWATATTVREAKLAVAAGADVILAQGAEAGGHRGAFDSRHAEAELVGLFSLLPNVVDAVGSHVPVVAAGGIADGRGVAAALILGASGVAVGTGFLRCPEAKIPSAWADAIGRTPPEDTRITRAFSGRAGRGIATEFVRAVAENIHTTPIPPYPVQRGLTQGMREAAQKNNDVARMQAWSGQSGLLARAEPAAQVMERMWRETQEILTR